MMNVAKQSIQRVKRGSSCEIKKVQGSSYALFFIFIRVVLFQILMLLR